MIFGRNMVSVLIKHKSSVDITELCVNHLCLCLRLYETSNIIKDELGFQNLG